MWFQFRCSSSLWSTLCFDRTSIKGPIAIESDKGTYRTILTLEKSVPCRFETFPVKCQQKPLTNRFLVRTERAATKEPLARDATSSQRIRTYLALGVCLPDLVGWGLPKHKGSLQHPTLASIEIRCTLRRPRTSRSLVYLTRLP